MAATDRIVIYVTADEKKRIYEAAVAKGISASLFVKAGALMKTAHVLAK